MRTELALIVFGSSIIVFFAEEFTRMAKKIWAIPGFKLLGPLLLASLFVEIYAEKSYIFLVWFQNKSLHTIQWLAHWFPFKFGANHIAKTLYLVLLASLPAWVFWLIAKRHGELETFAIPYRAGVMLWVLAMIILTVN